MFCNKRKFKFISRNLIMERVDNKRNYNVRILIKRVYKKRVNNKRVYNERENIKILKAGMTSNRYES